MRENKRDQSGGQNDVDALHILPLSMLPLKSTGLRRARLVKNARLQGVVELFSHQGTGSGQVDPHVLPEIFTGHEVRDDVEIVQEVSKLGSFDVYSLRIELRRCGIEVDNDDLLRLSAEKQEELSHYMRSFTRPLMAAVFGQETFAGDDLRGILKAFTDPDSATARQNLKQISQRLGVGLTEIPAFLQNYGDVYLSLAYYQSCLDRTGPSLRRFVGAMRDLNSTEVMRRNTRAADVCQALEGKLSGMTEDVSQVLDAFRRQTEDMWRDISGERFREVERSIGNYQSRIGGALCAVTVKLGAWGRRFPGSAGTPRDRVNFILAEMWPGLDRVGSLTRLH